MQHLDSIEQTELVGNRLCLDFINTANWVGTSSCNDRLVDGNSIFIWGERTGLLDKEVSKQALATFNTHANPPMVLDELRAFRQQLRGMFLDPQHQDQAACDTLTRSLKQAIDLRVTPSSKGVTLQSESTFLSWLMAPLAFSAVELLASPLAKRVKVCPGERCGWMFLDSSPNNRRRWCSMATCGNRHKARQHYAKQKSGKSLLDS